MDKDTGNNSLKSVQKRMLSKKILFILFFVCSTISFLQLFTTTVKSSAPLPISQITRKTSSHIFPTNPIDEGNLTPKELHLLSNLISQKAPCNLLFFGFRPQFLNLATLNIMGTTVFLEDEDNKDKFERAEGVRIYKVKYYEKAERAYGLLRHSRVHFGCKLDGIQLLEETNCRLAKIKLPQEVKERKWDVVVVDGPRGDSPEEPGRMEAIYMAAVIAREGNLSNVFVHDIDRMIERWYSWEFLCQENLAASKGKLWHFRIGGKSKSGSFCPENKLHIV